MQKIKYTYRYSFRVSQEFLDQVKELSERTGKKPSAAVRMAVYDALENIKMKNLKEECKY